MTASLLVVSAAQAMEIRHFDKINPLPRGPALAPHGFQALAFII
jgi:hypothetical protein